MTVTYRNQKFFLQIEGGEQVEIGNPELLPLTISTIMNVQKIIFHDRYCTVAHDGYKFYLPSGIGYRINKTCKWHGNRDACGNETCWDLEECQQNPELKLATLYVIEEEKEQESEWNQAINAALRVIYRFDIVQGNPIFNEIEKLKK